MSIDSKQFARLIGRHLDYQGHSCRIIEFLDDGPYLVLEDSGPEKTIQADQYGDARRRVARTFTVPVFNVRGDALNPTLEGLEALLSNLPAD